MLDNNEKEQIINNNLIYIKSITNSDNGQVKINIEIDNKTEEIMMTFSKNVIKYLTLDRCDAAVMGFIIMAIRTNRDIKSDIPISESLYYRITQDLIPGLCLEPDVYSPHISCPIIQDLKPSETQKIVATGISCGVDSLYSVMLHTNNACESFNLNSLVFLNAGAHHFGTSVQSRSLYEGRLELAKQFCKEVNLDLIEISTNLPDLIEMNQHGYEHPEHHTFCMLSCILMIQAGVLKYYYSGGYPYSEFDCHLKSGLMSDCAHFDLLTLACASNQTLQFYSTGGGLSRFDKVKAMKGYIPAEKFMNVCVADINNCGHCFKCKRTLLDLDAAGIIDNFNTVFDIEEYRKTRRSRILEGYRSAVRGDDGMLLELMPFFKSEISPTQRFWQKIRTILGRVYSFIFR